MLAAAVTAAVVASHLFPGERDLASYTFSEFKREHGKQYATAVEERRRSAIFRDNLRIIRTHNAHPDKSWWADVNRFTDWTNDEFTLWRTGGAHQSAAREANAVEEEEQPEREEEEAPSIGTPQGRAAAADMSLPDEVDWRTKPGVLTPVNDQGLCGSCWAFSAVETLESAYAVATGEPAIRLSEEQVVSCMPNPRQCGGTGGCNGGLQSLALNYSASMGGLTTASAYPYTGGGACSAKKPKPAVVNAGFVTLPTNDYAELMAAVATKGPIAISVAAGGMGWQIYKGGVFDGVTKGIFHPGCGWWVDHGVQLVGYGGNLTSRQLQEAGSRRPSAPSATGGFSEPRSADAPNGPPRGEDQAYWIVRNSWGAGWGEKGFIRLARHGEGKEPCGKDRHRTITCKGDSKRPVEYCGVCAMMSLSLYPTGVRKA